MNNNSRIPESYTEFPETLMSNFDHLIKKNVGESIKGKLLYAQYSGWNFCGYVWWEEDIWNCEVWAYNIYRKTFNAETLQEIMSLVSNEYGHD